MTGRVVVAAMVTLLAVMLSGCGTTTQKRAATVPVDTVVLTSSGSTDTDTGTPGGVDLPLVPPADPQAPARPAQPSEDPTPLAQAPAVPAVSQVTVVGESITLSAESQLRQRLPVDSFDAVAGRQFAGDLAALEAIVARGELDPTVVFHGGSNGPIPDGGLERLADLVDGRRLVVVTVSVPRDWEEEVNAALLDFARRREGTVVADWKTQTELDEGLLISDHVHLTELGRSRYAELVAAAVARG